MKRLDLLKRLAGERMKSVLCSGPRRWRKQKRRAFVEAYHLALSMSSLIQEVIRGR